MAYNFEYLHASRIRTRNSHCHWSDAIIYMSPLSSIYVTAEALCIKNTSIDQIGLGQLISKHEMFCFEKTAFKTFKFSLEYLIF